MTHKDSFLGREPLCLLLYHQATTKMWSKPVVSGTRDKNGQASPDVEQGSVLVLTSPLPRALRAG